MFDTLNRLLQFYGPSSKAVVWEHNSHIGDASATEMAARGELNDEQLSAKLWGVIHAIHNHGALLYSTDHLSDRSCTGNCMRKP